MKKALKIIGILLLTYLIFLASFVVYLSTQEYKPEPVENIAVENSTDGVLVDKNQVSILSFNTGYAGFGNNADFFMDKGKSVIPTDKERMDDNLKDIVGIIDDVDADFTLLQKVDQDSKRSYNFNQVNYYMDQLGMSGAFALEYKCAFVPYPIPPIGKVNSGLLTMTNYSANATQRFSLPCSFSWPVRTANFKRCMLVSRYPIANSSKELVIINLCLDAYDDGEGRVAQTQVLIDRIKEEYAKGNYVIAGGDFNQTFPGGLEKYPMLNHKLWQPGTLDDSMLPEGWHFAYDIKNPSCRSLDKPYDSMELNNQYYVLDGFIVSPNIEVNNIEVLDYSFKASNHNPVYLNATLK